MLSVGLLALPVLSELVMTAREFIVVLFGEKWLPSVPVFQALCALGALKLVNTYAGSTTQALGLFWAEAWRQVLVRPHHRSWYPDRQPVGIVGRRVGRAGSQS